MRPQRQTSKRYGRVAGASRVTKRKAGARVKIIQGSTVTIVDVGSIRPIQQRALDVLRGVRVTDMMVAPTELFKRMLKESKPAPAAKKKNPAIKIAKEIHKIYLQDIEELNYFSSE